MHSVVRVGFPLSQFYQGRSQKDTRFDSATEQMDPQGNAANANGGQVEVADLARRMNEMMVQFNALATYVQNQGTQENLTWKLV